MVPGGTSTYQQRFFQPGEEAFKFSEPSYHNSAITSTNHLAAAMNVSHKHRSSEVNRDMSESIRSAKKYRAEEVGPQIPPVYSIGSAYDGTLIHTRVMRMCQHDLLARKVINQELFSSHGTTFLPLTAFGPRQPQVKSPVELQGIEIGDSDVHGRSANWNLDSHRIQMLGDIIPSVIMPSQAMTSFPPNTGTIDYSMNNITSHTTGSELTAALNHVAAVNYFPQSYSSPTSSMMESNLLESKIPSKLPFCVARPADKYKISEHQLFLRFQIEAFAATDDDVSTHVRGRNRRILLGQVGIRCRHCAHLPASRRQKGAAYFPANTMGLYQAAQNMSTSHIQCGLCPEMPEFIKETFKGLIAIKSYSSGAGRPYWSKTAKDMGLVNTADGIRFIRDIPEGTVIIDDSELKK